MAVGDCVHGGLIGFCFFSFSSFSISLSICLSVFVCLGIVIRLIWKGIICMAWHGTVLKTQCNINE